MINRPDVRPGQVWADNDKRAKGRTLRVERIVGSVQGDSMAVCTILTNRDPDDVYRYADEGKDMRGRTVRIKVSRMRPTSTGYRLIQDASPAGGA